MENTILLEPDIYTGRQLPKADDDREKTVHSPVVSIPGMQPDSGDDDTDELPRSGSAMRRAAVRRRSRIPFSQLMLALAGAAAGAYFAMTLPEGADLSGSLLCRSGDFAGLLVYRILWGGAFLLAEYICGYFALGWLFVWAAPLVCGLGTGAALTAAFSAGMNAAFLVVPAAGIAVAVALGAGTSRMMSGQLLELVSARRGVVADSPAAGEYTLRFLIWFGVVAACALVECALRCIQ